MSFNAIKPTTDSSFPGGDDYRNAPEVWTPEVSAPMIASGLSLPADFPPVHLLVVDDETAMERLFTQRFRHQIASGEWHFSFARNGIEALDILRQDATISVVLVDLNMPEMDGLTLLKKIDKLSLPVRCIILSAYSDMANIRTAMNCGAFDFLCKPIDFEDVAVTLVKTLRSVHEMRESHRAAEYLQTKERAELEIKRLQDLEQQRKEITTMIVHDLRTPLSSVITGLRMLLRSGPLNVVQKECHFLALTGGQRMLDIVNDLLDVDKMEAGFSVLQIAPFSIPQLIEEAIELVNASAQDSGLSLACEIEPDLPSLPGDIDKLRRTLVNLLGNAIKFAPQSGIIRIAVRRQEDEAILFSVSDSGEGIPSGALHSIFDKFCQAGTRHAGHRMSSGLGLAFCKMIVEAHAGRIWAESEAGQGSRFSFTLSTQLATGS